MFLLNRQLVSAWPKRVTCTCCPGAELKVLKHSQTPEANSQIYEKYYRRLMKAQSDIYAAPNCTSKSSFKENVFNCLIFAAKATLFC